MGEDSAAQRINTGLNRQGDDSEVNEGFSITSRGLTDPTDPNGGETLVVKFLVVDDNKGRNVLEQNKRNGFRNA